MKKLLIAFGFILGLMLLAACDSEDNTKENDNVLTNNDQEENENQSENENNNATNNENSNEADSDEENEEESQDYDEVLLDSDIAKVVLKDIEKVVDEDWDDEYYDINLEIENHHDQTLEFQTREFSIDGKMVDDMVFFSETVASEKSADATIKIENYDGDLPEMEEDIEFTLVLFDMEDFEVDEEHDVSITIK